jgi:hypothetical protein
MAEFQGLSEEGQNFIAKILTLETRDKWHGKAAVPPGSVLDDILTHFERHTDIPLELPFIGWMTYFSGWLCAQDVRIQIADGQTISPRLWNIALAPSGSGKTFAVNHIRKDMKSVPEMENTASGVALIQAIQRTPKGIWFRDEMGQYLKSITTQPHMEKAKDVLLNAYNGDRLEHTTKKDTIAVEDYAFSILGITVRETFLAQVGAESLVDGFAQRFSLIVAQKDAKRPMTDYPLYFDDRKMTRDDTRRKQRITKEMESLLARDDIQGKTLKISDDAMDIFTAMFQESFKGEMPESFYRRLMFVMFSYAAIYHYLLGHTGDTINNQAMAYASRVVMIHMKDTKTILEDGGYGELHHLITKCQEWKDAWEAKNGRKAKARDLISGVRQIKTISEANAILKIIQ